MRVSMVYLIVIAAAVVAIGCAGAPAESDADPGATSAGAAEESEALAASSEAAGDPELGDGHGHDDHGHDHGDGHGHDHGNGMGKAGHHHGGDLGHGHHDKRFVDAAAWAERFDNPERDAWQKPADVVAAMAIEPGMVVADIGAGTGYFLPHLSAAVGAEGEVHGLDIEAAMVEWMTQRAADEGLGNVVARVVPGDSPGLEAGSADRVLIVNTWHHIPNRTAYATELAASLRPGGALYIVDYTMESEHGPPPKHRLAPETVIAELEAGGLAGEVVDVDLPRQYVVRAVVP